jgi:hypothetical protein
MTNAANLIKAQNEAHQNLTRNQSKAAWLYTTEVLPMDHFDALLARLQAKYDEATRAVQTVLANLSTSEIVSAYAEAAA